MGYLDVFSIMERKRALYLAGSSDKLTNQRIIEDRMVAHYKKLYSAKAAVDCSVPKSMQCHVKYTDQKRREQAKKSVSRRSQSVISLSDRSLRSDNNICSSRNTRHSARGADGACSNSGESVMSSPRFRTSFNCKQAVYPSQIFSRFQNCWPSTELSYRSPDSQRHHSTLSGSTSSSSQKKFTSFQDHTQKTYSGDVLLKHAHRFTQEKPFTPRTLKTGCRSTLHTYRYYTPASRIEKEEKTPSKDNQPNTQCRSKQRPSTAQDSLQLCSGDQEWSEEESNVFGHCGMKNELGDSDFFLSASRVSPDGMKSPIMRKVTAEEEELMYLEFITDVTNDIILRGIYTDRVLARVFERHIDMNKHRLDEDKMRHLLEVLQNDLQTPTSSTVTVLKSNTKDGDCSSSHRHKGSGLRKELDNFMMEDTSCLSLMQLSDEDTWRPDCVTPTLNSTPVIGSIENVKSVRHVDGIDIMDLEKEQIIGRAVFPGLENHQVSEKGRHRRCDDDLDDLGRNMAESLHLSENHNLPEVELEKSVKLNDEF